MSKKSIWVPAMLLFFLLSGTTEASYEEGVEARGKGDHSEAMIQWMVASDDPRCMTAIGVMFDYGEGIPEDDAKAAEWYSRAAEKGEFRAIAQLANFSLTGAGGVEKHPEMWRKRLEEIEGKDAYADYILSCFYMDGYGGARDLEKASTMLRGLVEKGYTQLEAISRQVDRRLSDERAGVLEVDLLIAEMLDNEASFDYSFKDCRIVLTGKVTAVRPLADRGYLLRLGAMRSENVSDPAAETTSRDSILAAFYAPAVDSLALPQVGETLKVKGIYIGKNPFDLPFDPDMSAFTLFDCSLVEQLSEDVRP